MNDNNSNNQNVRNVRNIAVVAHVDHGKTTLSDALVKRAGLSNQERYMDSGRKDQMDRIITIKSTGANLQLEELSVNLIDSPGHVDFSSEVTTALRLTDGCILVVDCAKGVSVQTETVLRQALSEHVRPVLCLNKLDKLFGGSKMSPEEVYLQLEGIVTNVNAIIATYSSSKEDLYQLDPRDGNVVFGSGKQGWGFSIPQIAALYAAKSGLSVEKIMRNLWGNRFQSSKSRRWSGNANKEGEKGVRGFCKYVMEPLNAVYAALPLVGEADWDAAEAVLQKYFEFGAFKKSKTKDWKDQERAGRALHLALPLADPLIEMIRSRLPCPVEAQKYRAEHLYTGPKEDAVFKAIQACDADGPLCVYVAKLVPDTHGKFFWAFGRVLSGRARANQKVTVLGSLFDPSKPKLNVFVNKTVTEVAAPLGKKFEKKTVVEAGNVVLLQNMDKYLLKSGTVFGGLPKDFEYHPIKNMKFTVTAVVRRSVKPKYQKDIKTFKLALTQLEKSDPLVQVVRDAETQETIVAGSGELHLSVCMDDLRFFAKGIELSVGQPVVSFRETCIAKSPEAVLAKSSNKHNRVYSVAAPMEPEVLTALEEDEYDTAKDSKRLWAIGASKIDRAEIGFNSLTNETAGVDYLNEAKGHFLNSFKKLCQKGPLCGERVRGVTWGVTDAKLHSDSAHRGGSEVMPAVRRSLTGAMLTAQPRLLEPMYLCTIECPTEIAGSIYNFLATRRGSVIEERVKEDGTPMTDVIAHLPILESFGFDEALRKHTSGKAFPVLEFSHWKLMESDPLEEGTRSNVLVTGVRKRKGLKENLVVKNFVDKL